MNLVIYLFWFLFFRWSAIAARLPGRTDNEIKNYWNTHIRKRLLRMGIDPVTHSPRLDLLDLSSILSSQISMARFLGAQSQQQQEHHQALVNPELIKLATSLMSSSPSCSSSSHHHQRGLISSSNNHQNPYLQNDQNYQLCGGVGANLIISPHLQQLVQNNQLLFQDQQVQACPTLEAASFGSPSSRISEWQSCNSAMPNLSTDFQEDLDNYVPVLPGYSASTSAYNYGQEQNLSFATAAASVLSTPSSSPTTALNSNSTTTTTTTYLDQDEPAAESYCSDMFKFEISDILLDANYEFM